MTPPFTQFESRICRTNAPAKRGRKSYTTPEVIDVTGRTHFMVIRKVQKNKKPKKKLNNYDECRNCELNDEYVDVLEERVDTLENLVNKLNNKVTKVSRNSPTNFSEQSSYSNLDMNSLLRLSGTLGQILCNDISNSKHSSATTETEFINKNVMPELWNTTNTYI
jgi:hypothetical protein